LIRSLRAFRRLPRAERRATVRAALTVARVECALRRRPLPLVVEGLGFRLGDGPEGSETGERPHLDEAERRRVRATRRVLGLSGRPQCLRTSLVLGHLLRDRAPILRIGVAPGADGVRAHAWPEIDGHVLDASRADTSGFRLLTHAASGG